MAYDLLHKVLFNCEGEDVGLISFVKNAGKSLFGNKEEEARIEAEVQAKADMAREVLERRKQARALELRIEAMALEIEGLDVEINDGTVVLQGKAPNQETAEKAALTVGNIQGVEAVDNRIEVEEEVEEAKYHTVVSGDTLSKIAREHYGDAGKYPVIFEANKPMLDDPNKIYPGQVLRIPAI
ncbi:MAG: peptidoglycan-binding protein LysM [Acidobacteriota bacterium]